MSVDAEDISNEKNKKIDFFSFKNVMFVDTVGLLGLRPPTRRGHWLCCSVSKFVSVAPQTQSRTIVFVTTCTLVV